MGNDQEIEFQKIEIGIFQEVESLIMRSELAFFRRSKLFILLGGGRNVDDQNVDRPKISERRNGLFS
jgi:hypothetical protein